MEKHYHPGSPLRQPFTLLREMLCDVIIARGLAWRLLLRNIRAQYRQSLLGIAWAFVPPVVMTATFVLLSKSRVIALSSGREDLPYPLFVMAGTILWQLFVDSVNSPIRLMATSKSMLVKINFPREALILAGMGEVLLSFLIRLLLLCALMVWYQVPMPECIWLAPLGCAAIAVLGLMVGLLLTPAAMLYTDVESGLSVVLSMWFFVTPVVYAPLDSGISAWLARANPVSPLLITTRAWILDGPTASIGLFIVVTLVSVFLLAVAWLTCRIAMPHLVARIGA